MSERSDPRGNSDYHSARAAEERDRAKDSPNANARASHEEMADRHAKLAEGPEQEQAAK